MGIRLGHISAVTIDMAHLESPGSPAGLSYGFQTTPRGLQGDTPYLVLRNVLQPRGFSPPVSRTSFRVAVGNATGRYLADRITSTPFKAASLPESVEAVCDVLEQAAPAIVSGKQEDRKSTRLNSSH